MAGPLCFVLSVKSMKSVVNSLFDACVVDESLIVGLASEKNGIEN